MIAMSNQMGAHINALFAPRPAPEHKAPYSMQVGKKRGLPYSGLSAYLSELETPEEYENNFRNFKAIEQRMERRIRISEERKESAKMMVEANTIDWNPSAYTFESDAYKTLFVGRLSYLTDEAKLKREMEQYGSVKSVTMVNTKDEGKPRGYGFVEFEHERDMKTAYKHADGRKIDGKRILVDVERGRTVKEWKPRHLGGGLGSSRKEKPKKTKQEKAEVRRQEAAQARADKMRAQRHAEAAKRAAESAASQVDGRGGTRGGYNERDRGGDRRGYDDRSRDYRGGGDTQGRSDYRGGR